MNNYEKIKNMSLDEMAEFINDFADVLIKEVETKTELILNKKDDYKYQLKRWLQEESE